MNNTPLSNSKITIASIMERYLELQKLHLNKRSYLNCKGEYTIHIYPFFANYAVESMYT